LRALRAAGVEAANGKPGPRDRDRTRDDSAGATCHVPRLANNERRRDGSVGRSRPDGQAETGAEAELWHTTRAHKTLRGTANKRALPASALLQRGWLLASYGMGSGADRLADST
jgi:hypothetical protein